MPNIAVRIKLFNAAQNETQSPRCLGEGKESTNVHDPYAPDNYLNARAVHCRAHRFWARAREAFGNSTDEYMKVHSRGPAQADVTEGSSGIWERLHYDWSDPNHVVLKTTDSNTWGGASGHTYTFTRRSDGLTDIDLVTVRDGKNLKGWLVGLVVGTIGKGVLEKAFKNSVKAIEARNGMAREVGAA